MYERFLQLSPAAGVCSFVERNQLQRQTTYKRPCRRSRVTISVGRRRCCIYQMHFFCCFKRHKPSAIDFNYIWENADVSADAHVKTIQTMKCYLWFWGRTVPLRQPALQQNVFNSESDKGLILKRSSSSSSPSNHAWCGVLVLVTNRGEMRNKSQGSQLRRNLWRAVARYSYIPATRLTQTGAPVSWKTSEEAY